MLIPSDSYDGLICAACVDSSEFVKSKAGSEGWMTIEPDAEGFKVVGRGQGRSAIAEPGSKRHRDDDNDGTSKRLKTDEESGVTNTGSAKAEARSLSTSAATGGSDVFLSHGIRDALRDKLDVGCLICTLDAGRLTAKG